MSLSDLMQCAMACWVVKTLLALLLTGLFAAPGVQGTRGEHGHRDQHAAGAVIGRHRHRLRASGSRCPGTPTCSGNGECDEATATCWCRHGFGSSDCSTAMIDAFRVDRISDKAYEELTGNYRLERMYLQQGIKSPGEAQFLWYDSFNSGWAISKLNSSCRDDMCFFGYAKDAPLPPPKGYVFGGGEKHVYYRQLVFDDAEIFGNGKMPGIHVGISYTPDPNAPDVNMRLTQFNGRYVQQPRYVHEKTGRYAIMPLDLNCPGKTWALLGLLGEGAERHWKILATAKDPSYNRYMIPAGPWKFPTKMHMEVEPSCSNHVDEEICDRLEGFCGAGHKDSIWVRQCCKSTCGTCDVTSSCSLPHTALIEMASRVGKL